MRYVTYMWLVYSIFLLTSCAYKREPFLSPDLSTEIWQHDVDTNPSRWVKNADRWFLTGDPNHTEESNRHAPYSQATSTMMVRVSDSFNKIKVNGSFQVQVYGSDEHNSVSLIGPNEEVRDTEVRVVNDTLYLRQAKDSSLNLEKVIVRVGMKNLRQLIQAGPGLIEGRMVRSDNLIINAAGSGDIFLSGAVNVSNITATGKGSINVFGALTPDLVVYTNGASSVNVSGDLGLRFVMHHGTGNINMIGVNSRRLKVYADGRGKIGLNGRFDVSEVTARDSTCIYGYNVASGSLYVYVFDRAHVGLAGYVSNLAVDASKTGIFEGRHLLAYDAYVRAKDAAHINVSTTNKLFAAATQNSSVYFFGSPKLLSQFVNGNGVVIPVWGGGAPKGFARYQRYKDEPSAASSRKHKYH